MSRSRVLTMAGLALLLLVGGCTSLLPVSHTNTAPWATYEEARAAVASLVPMKSSMKSVERNGIDFVSLPNTKILTKSDVVQMLVPSGMLKRDDLDPGIVVCLEARDACYGLDITASRIAKTRTGNFFADFITYRQRTETTGYRFKALILFVDDLVVYRSWGGQPNVNEVEVNTKPLGPFQDAGPSLVSSMR